MQQRSQFGVALLTVVLCSGFATAQEKAKPPTLEQLDKSKGLEDALNLIDKLEAQIEVVSSQKRSQCLRAIGNPAFCECLVSNLPVGASFLSYVQILSSSKEEIGYPKLSKDDKGMVDVAIKTREICVTKFVGGE
jgi:hypothetical protein